MREIFFLQNTPLFQETHLERRHQYQSFTLTKCHAAQQKKISEIRQQTKPHPTTTTDQWSTASQHFEQNTRNIFHNNVTGEILAAPACASCTVFASRIPYQFNSEIRQKVRHCERNSSLQQNELSLQTGAACTSQRLHDKRHSHETSAAYFSMAFILGALILCK